MATQHKVWISAPRSQRIKLYQKKPNTGQATLIATAPLGGTLKTKTKARLPALVGPDASHPARIVVKIKWPDTGWHTYPTRNVGSDTGWLTYSEAEAPLVATPDEEEEEDVVSPERIAGSGKAGDEVATDYALTRDELNDPFILQAAAEQGKDMLWLAAQDRRGALVGAILARAGQLRAAGGAPGVTTQTALIGDTLLGDTGLGGATTSTLVDEDMPIPPVDTGEGTTDLVVRDVVTDEPEGMSGRLKLFLAGLGFAAAAGAYVKWRK